MFGQRRRSAPPLFARIALPEVTMPSTEPAPRPPAPAAGPAPRKRVALYDNLKGILIVLVVFGHMMHPVHNANPALSTCFDLIYLFHMPLFVFLSGLFAKGAYRDGKLNVNRIVSFLVMGLCYQAALLAINGVLLDKPWRLLLFTSAPWYLVGMAGWYALTPLLSRLGPARGMAASLAVSLAWGCVDLSNGFLALSRTLAFLPCFAAGYYCPLDRCAKLKQCRSLWIAVVAAVLIALPRLFDAHAYDWFFQLVYGDNPYAGAFGPGVAGTGMLSVIASPASALSGMAEKLMVLGIAAVFSLAALKLAPARASWLTVLGERTLQIYVLHRLIRAWLTFRTDFYDLPVLLDPVLGTAIIALLSAAVVALCALPAFTKPFDRLARRRWLPSPPAK